MTAKLLAYSTSWVNNPILTVLVKVPTVKLAELRTHRILHQLDVAVEHGITDKNISVNANSSRAIPLQKQINGELFIPLWTIEQKGMQGEALQGDQEIKSINDLWNYAEKNAKYLSKELSEHNIHKQDAALLLNPFTYTTCIITADKTGWESFFELRCPKYEFGGLSYKSKREFYAVHNISDIDFDSINTSMTYPAIQQIAEEIYDLWTYKEPNFLSTGEWHLPFREDCIFKGISVLNSMLKLSMSKCAMISFDNLDKEESLLTHTKRANQLILNLHTSTSEHQSKVPSQDELFSPHFQEKYVHDAYTVSFKKGKYISNLKGWIQLRKLIESGEFE